MDIVFKDSFRTVQ